MADMIMCLRRFKKTGKRNEIFLATKFGFTGPEFSLNGTPEYVKEAAEASLKRLGIETIDLYYLHVSSVIYVHVLLKTNLVSESNHSEQTRTHLLRYVEHLEV